MPYVEDQQLEEETTPTETIDQENPTVHGISSELLSKLPVPSQWASRCRKQSLSTYEWKKEAVETEFCSIFPVLSYWSQMQITRWWRGIFENQKRFLFIIYPYT